MIAIVNYGMGNLMSVKNALDHLGAPCAIVDDPSGIEKADKIILPGVGAFGMAMANLMQRNLTDVLKEQVLAKKKPILGICLGMQLLLNSSVEHGLHQGLSLVDGEVKSFGDAVHDLNIPHMGWNGTACAGNSTLFKGLSANPDFYFVHSYYCQLKNSDQVSGSTDYGITFHSALETENIYGCQFHPEKSQKNGLAIFSNFHAL